MARNPYTAFKEWYLYIQHVSIEDILKRCFPRQRWSGRYRRCPLARQGCRHSSGRLRLFSCGSSVIVKNEGMLRIIKFPRRQFLKEALPEERIAFDRDGANAFGEPRNS